MNNIGWDDVQPHRLRLLTSMGFTDPKFLTAIISDCAEYIDLLQRRIQLAIEAPECNTEGCHGDPDRYGHCEKCVEEMVVQAENIADKGGAW